MKTKIQLAGLAPLPKLDDKEGDKALEVEQDRLVKIQQAYLFGGNRAVVVFEGMDAAGKGGTIRRIAWALDPRSLYVWPIGAPNEMERNQHYLQRFWRRLPERKQISVFDRSWYGRVLVERVEGLAKPVEWRRAYREINEFEQQLTDDGIRIVKIFLHVSKEEQLERFEARLNDPLKRWKLSYEDFRNRAKWDDYISAAEEMFDRTSTQKAPWHVINSDRKPPARIVALRIIADTLSDGIDLANPPLEPRVVEMAAEVLGKRLQESAATTTSAGRSQKKKRRSHK